MAGAARAPAVGRHTTRDDRTAGGSGVEFAHRSVIELFAGLHFILGRAYGGEVGGLQGGTDLFDGPGEID